MNTPELPEIISSDRIELRKHDVKLAKTMFEYVDRDRKRLAEFLPWVDHTRTVNDEVGFIEMIHEKWQVGELFDWGIFRKEDDRYLGNIGMHGISKEHKRAEIGYWILGEFEGQGFMSEALRALEKACFTAGFFRLEVRCSSANLRSARVPESCGYHLDGTLREDCIEGDRRRNTLIYSKLATDVKLKN